MAEGIKVQTHFSSSDRQVPAAAAINTILYLQDVLCLTSIPPSCSVTLDLLFFASDQAKSPSYPRE